jgi:hypothetical protein
MTQRMLGVDEASAAQDAVPLRDTIRKNAPMIASGLAGLATGGAGLIPSALVAGGTYGVSELLMGTPPAQAAKDAAMETATGMGMGGAIKAAVSAPARAFLDRSALRWIKGGLKIPLSYLDHMSGASKEGADAMEDRIAQTILNENLDTVGANGVMESRRIMNPMRGSGVMELQRRIEDAAQKYQGAVDAAPNVPIQGVSRRALNATHRVSGERINQTDPTKDLRQVQGVRKSMVEHPRYGVDPNNPQAGLADTTPRQTADMIAADNKVLSESFGKTPKIARLDAIKAARASRAADLDAVAGTSEITTRMRDLIDARNVSDLARQRAGKRDAIGITDIISLSSARPAVLAATTLMRPAVQLGGGIRLGRASQKLGKVDPVALREAIRALVASMSHGQE